VAKTLAGYRTGLLNHFKHPITSAVVEGINNKIKTPKGWPMVSGMQSILSSGCTTFTLKGTR